MARPSKYKPEYCEQLIEHMREGLSFESFSAVIGVNRDSLYEWTNKHQEFSDAKKVGLDHNLLFWEKVGRNGALGKIPNFNPTTWIFNMKNRHLWKDKQPEEVSQINLNVDNQSDEDLLKEIETLKAQLLKEKKK